MVSIALSKNFSLNELTISYQAKKHGIVNEPSDDDVKSLKNLCITILQPLRDFYGKPIVVSSGFRSNTVNRIVGGVAPSQHLRGEAADIVFPNLSVAVDWMHFISHNCSFDQMLLERNCRTGAQWLHVSCCRNTKKNRHQIRFILVG